MFDTIIFINILLSFFLFCLHKQYTKTFIPKDLHWNIYNSFLNVSLWYTRTICYIFYPLGRGVAIFNTEKIIRCCMLLENIMLLSGRYRINIDIANVKNCSCRDIKQLSSTYSIRCYLLKYVILTKLVLLGIVE